MRYLFSSTHRALPPARLPQSPHSPHSPRSTPHLATRTVLAQRRIAASRAISSPENESHCLAAIEIDPYARYPFQYKSSVPVVCRIRVLLLSRISSYKRSAIPRLITETRPPSHSTTFTNAVALFRGVQHQTMGPSSRSPRHRTPFPFGGAAVLRSLDGNRVTTYQLLYSNYPKVTLDLTVTNLCRFSIVESSAPSSPPRQWQRLANSDGAYDAGGPTENAEG
ncbi:hypothetical protein V9T40_007515 [Parthenolecanium corni]|uniref:Uncharacterized protein n=1 Tax=Parthenolecanium corni TaxID=536013 RepID=A0AAN9Y5X2_9HEMI